MSVLIRGGRVITASDDYVADVFVDNGVVTQIGKSLDQKADRVIDARDRYLLPVMLVGAIVLVWGLLNPPSKATGPAKLLLPAELLGHVVRAAPGLSRSA